MNRLYVILPALLLAGFGFVYQQQLRTEAGTAAPLAAESARARQAESARVLDEAQQAKTEAEKHAAERTAAEKSAGTATHDAWVAETRRLTDAADAARAECARLGAETVALQERLNSLHTSIGTLEHETFEQENALELSRIDLTTAQLEVQRLTALLIARSAK